MLVLVGEELPAGLYEQLITKGLRERLDVDASGLHPDQVDLRSAEAADRFALHLSRSVERSLHAVGDTERLVKGQEVVAALLDRLGEIVAHEDLDLDQLIEPAQLLRALLRVNPDGTPRPVAGPLIPLLDTTLLTNAPGEPNVGSQVRAEIASADRIDLVMAFIRRTGVNPLMGPLRRHCADGKQLRILTTTYTDSTELRALESLLDLGAEVRVSYDTSTTRLHAKSWLSTGRRDTRPPTSGRPT